jgi:hypothetical protein
VPSEQRELINMRLTLGDSHPDTLTAQGNLAITLRALGQTDEAHRLLGQVIAAMAARLPHGESHPIIVALRSGSLIDFDLESQPI